MATPTPPPGRTLSMFGVGPWFVALSVLYSALGITARICLPQLFTITLVPRAWLQGAGIVLILTGLCLFVASLRVLAKGFPQGILFTRGPYAACRHPLYSSWVVFLVPGLGLMVQSWPVLCVTLAMYVTLKVLVRKEEDEMLRLFGQEYQDYRDRTPAVFPLLHRCFT